jgi:hypothetical protein
LLPKGLSDYDAQILTLNNPKLQNPPNYSVCIGEINEFTKSEFTLNLGRETCADVVAIKDDVNIMFSNFLNTYLIILASLIKSIFLNKK